GTRHQASVWPLSLGAAYWVEQSSPSPHRIHPVLVSRFTACQGDTCSIKYLTGASTMMYHCDISEVNGVDAWRCAGTGHPGRVAGDAVARLRAAQAAEHDAGHHSHALLRFAVPVPETAGGWRLDRTGGDPAAWSQRPAGQDRLPAHPGRPAPPGRLPGGRGPGRLGRRILHRALLAVRRDHP